MSQYRAYRTYTVLSTDLRSTQCMWAFGGLVFSKNNKFKVKMISTIKNKLTIKGRVLNDIGLKICKKYLQFKKEDLFSYCPIILHLYCDLIMKSKSIIRYSVHLFKIILNTF